MLHLGPPKDRRPRHSKIEARLLVRYAMFVKFTSRPLRRASEKCGRHAVAGELGCIDASREESFVKTIFAEPPLGLDWMEEEPFVGLQKLNHDLCLSVFARSFLTLHLLPIHRFVCS
jgi:hypothetical protein